MTEEDLKEDLNIQKRKIIHYWIRNFNTINTNSSKKQTDGKIYMEKKTT